MDVRAGPHYIKPMLRMLPVLCLLAVGLLLPAAAWAEQDSLLPARPLEPAQPALRGMSPQLRQRGPVMTPSEAARQVQRRHGGRVLSVQPDGAGYSVKVLKDGEVRIFQVQP
jgi:hypothetical protein